MRPTLPQKGLTKTIQMAIGTVDMTIDRSISLSPDTAGSDQLIISRSTHHGDADFSKSGKPHSILSVANSNQSLKNGDRVLLFRPEDNKDYLETINRLHCGGYITI